MEFSTKLVCSPLSLVFPEPTVFLRAGLVLCALLNLGTACLLYRIGLRLGGRWAAGPLVVGWTWLLVNWQPFLSAMETSLYLLVFVWFLDLLLRERISRWLLSLAGGLLLLCRVDAVILVAAGLAASLLLAAAVTGCGPAVETPASPETSDEQAAEDVFQETFIKVFEHRKDFRGKNFAAWLFTIARHTCLNHIRSKKEYESFDEVFHSKVKSAELK